MRNFGAPEAVDDHAGRAVACAIEMQLARGAQDREFIESFTVGGQVFVSDSTREALGDRPDAEGALVVPSSVSDLALLASAIEVSLHP